MAKLGEALDLNPFESEAGLGPALDFNPFEPSSRVPPDERELNLPALEGTAAPGIPLPPERERPVPLPTARPAAAAEEEGALSRTLTALGDIPEAVLRGYYGAKTGANILGVETGQVSPEEAAANIAENIKKGKEVAMPESVRKGMEALQKAKGWKETFQALADHPDVLPSVLGESAASSLVSTGTGLIGALTGATVGSVVPVVGTAAGATAGLVAGVGAGSAATEYASTLNDFLTSQGIDTSDPEQLKAAFSNPEIMAAARKDAAIRGVAVGAFDALTAGVAGKLFGPVKKALGEGAVGAVLGTGAEIGTQALGGAGGEAAAQLGTKGEITSPSDIALESAGEIIPGLGEVAISKLTGASPSEKVQPTAEAPAAPPSPEQPVEAPGPEAAPAPEAAAPAAPEAAPPAPIPANEDIAILKGANYDIEQILDMSPRELAAKVRDARESGIQPVELSAEDIAAIEAAKPATLGEPVAQPEGLPAPEETAAPAPKRPVGYNELRAAGYTQDQIMKMGSDVVTNPDAPLPPPEGTPDPSWLEYRGEEPAAPAPKAVELVQEGATPLEAIKEAGAAPVEPAPEAAPAPEIQPLPIEPAAEIPRIEVNLPFALKGQETQVKVGDTYLPARYAVVDADNLKATLGKAINQFRDRERVGSQGQIEKIANAPDWNQLNAAPVMDFGSPTLDRNGLIVGGNGRFEGLSRAYERGTAGNYRNLLKKNAAQFGVDPATFAKMKKPVLMRIIEADVDTGKLAMASNEGAGLRMSMLEQAKVDAERLPDLGILRVGENGEISAAGNRDLIKNWTKEMPATEIGGIVDAQGALSQEGLIRLRNAIMHKAYGDSPTLGRIIESLDQGSKNIAAALVRSAPRSARVKELIASGDLYPLDITNDILDAAEKFEQLRNEGQKIRDYLDQGQMFGSDISPEARKILQFFGDHMRSAKSMSELFNKYLDKVEAVGNPKQAGIFGEEAAPSKGELLDAALQDARKVVPAAEAELPFGEAAPAPAPEAAPAPKEEAAPAPEAKAEPKKKKEKKPEAAAPAPTPAPAAAPAKEPSKSAKSHKSLKDWMAAKEQFSKSPNIPQEYLDVLADWATMLGMKQKIHLILDKDWKAFDFGNYKKPIRLAKTSNGLRTWLPREKSSVITINLHPRKSFNLEVLAHELGHAFEKEVWESSSKEERDAVMSDYRKFLSENKVKGAEEYVRALRAHVTGKLTKISPSFRQITSTKVLKPYWRSFDEYFADQVAKYMVSEERPQTIVGKYFARIADGLKRLYNSLAGAQGKARKSMKEYIDRRVNKADNILDSAESSAMEEVIGDEEPVTDESRSSLSQDTIDEIEELNRKYGMPKDIAPTKPDTPTETKLDKFRAKVQDVQIFLRKVQDEIEKKNGGPLIDTMNAYARNLLMPGRISERIHDLNKDMVKPLFKRMKDLGISLDDLHKYMLAKHAPERNREMAKRDPERFGTLFDGGSGLTNGAAEELLARLEPKKEALEELSGMVRKIIDSDLDRRVEAGLMTEDQANGLKELYKDYVPLRGFAERDMEEDHGGTFYNLGKGLTVSKEEYKKAMGRKSQADNVVLNAIMQAEEGIYRAEKNRALEALYNLAKLNPNPDLWQIGKMKAHKVIGEDGLVKWELDGMVGPNTVVVKIGGKPYYIDLKNPALAEAYGRLGPLPMARWFRPIATMTRAWSQLQTSKNPAFIATNFQRDLADALFYTYGKDADVAKEVVKSLPEALKLTTKATLQKLSPEEQKIFDEWRRSGGRISYNAITDIQEKSGEFNRLVGDVSPLEWYKLPQKTQRLAEKAFYKVVDGLEKVAQPFEDGVRASVFIAARKVKNKDGTNKYTVEQAARMAQEASVNFYRKGRYSPYLNGLYAFFNASTQGSAMGLKLLKDSKKARLAFMSMVPFSFMITMMNLGNSDDDPMQKGRKNYMNIPEFERETGLVIKYGRGPKDYFKIRMPSLLMIPIIMGEQAALAALGQQKLGKSVGNMFGGAINAFNPLGSSSLIGMVSPTLTDPIVDILVNKKYSGAPIHPQPAPWNTGIPNSEQAFSTTAPWASALTRTIYKGTAGAVDIYPGDAEYVANWMIGGLGRNTGNVISFMNDIRQGKDPKISDLPIIRTFAPTQWNPGGRYYELHDAVDGKVNRLRALAKDMAVKPSKEKIQEFNKEAAGTGIYFDGQKVVTSGAPAISAMRNADSILKQLRQQSIAVQNDARLSPRQQQQKVEAIKAQMERVMVGAGKQMSIFDPRPSFGPLSNLVK